MRMARLAIFAALPVLVVLTCAPREGTLAPETTTTQGGSGGSGATGGASVGGGGSGATGGASVGGGGTGPFCPSCDGLANTCGATGDMSCCAAPLVTGGNFLMGRCGPTYNASTCTDGYAGSINEVPEHSVTVSDFRLDAFEVTVGRFRNFVNQYTGSNKPTDGQGANPNLASSGWQSAWNASLPNSQAALITNLKYDATYQTWTDAVLAHENQAINCVSWYEAFAFCIYDGGRLPTEAEWEYAAAGGSENRLYPWGAAAPSASLANYNGSAASPLVDAGQYASGMGLYGQYDLAGGMYEWNLDWYDSGWYAGGGALCTNCANLSAASGRVGRGGSWYDAASLLRASGRSITTPTNRGGSIGFRCARSAL
jgi:sulfatase modifying factor 1